MKRHIIWIFITLMLVLFQGNRVIADAMSCCGGLGPVTLYESIVIEEGCECSLDGTTVIGTVTVRDGGSLSIKGAYIHGDIFADKASSIQIIEETLVDGTVRITGTTGPAPSRVTDAQIIGDLDIQKNKAYIEVRNNYYNGGDLILIANTGGLTVTHNDIDGDLICLRNDPPPFGIANTVKGDVIGQCMAMAVPVVAVPDVVGLSREDAEGAIAGAYLFTGEISTAYDFTVPAGHVISQTPAAGTVVDEDSFVDLQLSLGPPPPEVSLSANPETIIEGESSELSWSSENTELVSIDNGIGEVAINGSMPVSPVETVTYTITGTGPGGTATASVTVTVIPLPTAEIEANPTTIFAGESFELSWTTTHADIAVGQWTDSGGAVTEDIPLNGSSMIALQRTTTYTIIANGPGGTATDSVTVEVIWPAPTVQISANPAEILSGGATALSWTSSFAETCTISSGVGNVNIQGNLQIAPVETTTYVITATGPGGTATSEVSVSVVYPPPEIEFTADPLIIFLGDPSLLSWNALHAESCEIDQGIGPVPATGTAQTEPAQTTAYTITATGPGGSASRTVTIEVLNVDLEPIDIDLSGTALDPDTMLLTGEAVVELKNNGISGFENPFTVTLFEDVNCNETYDPDADNLLGSGTVDGYPDATASISTTIAVDSSVAFRDNRVFAFVDSENIIRETDETNNTINNMLGCEYTPPVGSFSPVVEWAWTGSSIASSSYNVVATPAVACLNDDNSDGLINEMDTPDVIFTTYAGKYTCDNGGTLRAVSGDGGGELFSITGYALDAASSPVIGDIDNDGLIEIITFSGGRGRIIAFENTGAFKWQSQVIPDSDLGPMIADIDADGNPEVIVGKYVFNSDGTTKWIGTGGNGRYHSISADINLDGMPELVAGNTAYDSTGNILWRNTAVGDGYVAVANFDDDPFPEIVVVSGGYIYLLEHTGEKKWGPVDIPRAGISNDHGGAPTIADFDNDGLPEIGVAGGYRYVVFEHTGQVKWAKTTDDYSSNCTGSSVFDFEGDGSAEVLYGDEHYFRVYRGTDGAVLQSWTNSSRTRNEYPLVVDVDNDNNAEIVLVANRDCWGSQRGIRIIGDANDTWVNTRKIWNQHAYHITNVNDDGTIPQFEANNWETFNNYRQNEMLNPFGCVDLTGSMIRLDRSGLPGAAKFLARAGNGGVLHVNPGVPVAFYNGDPQAGGILLGKKSTQTRIYPGHFEDVLFQWNNPPVEIKTIYARVDDNGAGKGIVSEIDEENNTAFATFNLGNIPPIAIAGDDQTVILGDTVALDGGQSHDPDGNPVTWEWTLVVQPEGSTAQLSDFYSAQTGFEPDVAGLYQVQLVVNDGVLDSGVSIVSITVSPPITVPDVTGISQQQAEAALVNAGLAAGTIDTQYSFDVPEGNIISQAPNPGTIVALNTAVDLTVSLGVQKVVVPDVSGMLLADAQAAVSNTGLTPGAVAEKYIDIQPEGRICGQSLSAGASVPIGSTIDLTVSLGLWTGEDTEPPDIALTANPSRVDLGATVLITVLASDNAGVTGISLTVDGNPVPLTGSQAYYLTQKAGFIPVIATAEDAAGHTTTATATLQVANPYDTIPPIAVLDEDDCIDVFDLYSLSGRVEDVSGVIYTLSVRPQGSSSWKVFAENSGSSFSGELGVFDPTVLKNGVYEILLYAKDLAGNAAYDTGCVLVDGQLKVGQVTLPAVDVGIPDLGFPLALEREYDSRDTTGDFGPGWSLPSSTVKPMTTRDLGGGWGEEARGSFMTTYYLIEKYRHVAVIRFSDEETLKFAMDVNPKSSLLVPITNHSNLSATFVPIDGTVGKLEALNVASSHLMLIGNNLYEYGADPYTPTRYKYTKPDGTVYVLSATTGIESITDVYGHTVSYSASGIHHSSGATIAIERGTGNRIETIRDPLGMTIEYHYDEDGMLTQVIRKGTEPVAVRVMQKYGYAMGIFDRPVLKDILAPDGTKLGQFEYDNSGRMTGLIDADGNRIIYGYDLPSHYQEITDRNGNLSIYNYDQKGYVTRKVDPLGYETAWTYNSTGKKLTETDANGHTSTWTYDASGNMLSEKDPLGNTTTYTYNSKNQVLARTDPLGHATTYTYDSLGNKLTETGPLGNTTVYTYDAHGHVLTETDPQGDITTYSYDTKGNRTGRIDPNGKVTTWSYNGYGQELTESATRTTNSGPVTMTATNTYDIRQRLTKTIDPMGYVTKYEYDFKDRKIAEIDKNNARTEFEYNGNGNQTAIHYADGTSMLTAYDPEGNRTAATDRASRTTHFAYDANDRMIRVTHPDSGTSDMEYDPAGRLVAAMDENGNETGFAYDAAGRRTGITDALGHTVAFTYDGAGNQTAVTDPKGSTTTYIYDAANRQVKTIYPGGTFTQTAYDEKGRKTAETDQEGNTTAFDYNGAGNLVTVTGALGSITDYTYDEAGNRTAHIDPNGHTETWTYDNLGRATSHTLPLGQTEYFTYDGMGNTLSHTDFNGDTIQYAYSPCCGRLTRKTYPNGSTVAYTYFGDGKRETVTDSRGLTQYEYDARGRLTEEIRPDGSRISYTYDARGNRTSVTVPSGTTFYIYDELNRLKIVTAPDGGVTSYTYDENGNRESVAYPNATAAEYTYDAQNRLIYLENRKSSGEIISSYFYTLGPAGNRLAVSEHTGRTVNYTYDAVYRLIGEAITDPANGNQTISYTYDPAGNRMTRTDGTGTTAYTYDANDRLLTESGPAFTHTYAYDANGNTITKSAAGDTTAYTYDYENRLSRMETLSALIQYTYDADGIRMGQTADGAITDYLVDKNRDYAQVLEERDGIGSLEAIYIFGDDLISQDRAGVDSYYHYDGLGSTRALTDAAESTTDTYIYEAFGGLIHQTGSTENHYLFTGEQYDPNAGFYYLRARYYDPGVGRFVAVDPLEGCSFEPETLHKYNYANMNPVMYVDPSGEFSIISTMTTLGIVSSLNTVRKANNVREHRQPNDCLIKTANKLTSCVGDVLGAPLVAEIGIVTVCAGGCIIAGPAWPHCFTLCVTVGTGINTVWVIIRSSKCMRESIDFYGKCVSSNKK